MSDGNVWSGIFDAQKNNEKKTTTNKYKELLERLLKEWAKKVEVGEENLPQIVVAPEGVEQYPIQEHGGGGIEGAIWSEKKLLYINTRVNGEQEWSMLIKHLLLHYRYPDLKHGVDFERASQIVDGLICNFQKKIVDGDTEIEVNCDLPRDHLGLHRKIKSPKVYQF